MPVIAKVPTPSRRDGTPHPLVVGVADVEAEVRRSLHGHADFTDSATSWSVGLLPTPYAETHVWVALAGSTDAAAARPEDVLGYLTAYLPLQEDTRTAYLDAGVRPRARSQGLGRRLADAARPFLAALGRSHALAWSFSPGLAEGPDALVPRSGVGVVDGSAPGARWLLAEGFVLEQAERQSTLDLSDRAGVRAHAHGLASAAARCGRGEYDVIGWNDETPAEHVDGIAVLCAAMSTDVPTADLELDPQPWDAARVRTTEARQRDRGYRWVTAAARHVALGELAAFTRLQWSEANPVGVWQDETLVRSAHRGRRLGMLVKATNLLRLLDANPDAVRVHTWNAAENEWMLAINDELGFRRTGYEGAWQRRG